MKPVLLPTTDVNSETAVLVKWHVPNRAHVAKGTFIGDLETSKAVFTVDAVDDGFLLQEFALGDTVVLTAPIAHIFEDLAALERYEAEAAKRREEAALRNASSSTRATAQARKRAEELGVDLNQLDGSKLITVKEVEAAAAASAAVDYSTMPKPLTAPSGVQRLFVIGAALGAMQVIDIFGAYDDRQVIAIVDDDRATWGGEVYGVPVVGGCDRLGSFFGEGSFDAAVISIGGSIRARVRLRTLCASHGIPLANAIDKTAKIASDVTIGGGNVICAFCQIGTGTTVGDNNFFSAHGSFDHHNIIGSENTTGPNCVTSGTVKIGSRVKMGMGVMIEPRVEIGDDVEVSSGAIILKSVPAQHAVKTKIVTTTVVPIRRA